jgi:hypothetical protein
MLQHTLNFVSQTEAAVALWQDLLEACHSSPSRTRYPHLFFGLEVQFEIQNYF